MTLSWKLGRVAGIDLYLHPTALLIWFIAGGVYGVNLVDATPYAVALLASITVHEVGHAWMARQYGIGARDITLYVIGGIVRLERLPRSAGPELLIALAGPVVSLVVGMTLLGVAGLSQFVGLPGGFLIQVGFLNLGLGLFNLLPAFPMDGGRILRAALTGWLGRVRATGVAVTVGQFLAAAGGVFGLLSGDWALVLLAVVIYAMAGIERFQVVAAERFGKAGPRGLIDPPAPPTGFRWATGRDGVWRLVPIMGRARNWGQS